MKTRLLIIIGIAALGMFATNPISAQCAYDPSQPHAPCDDEYGTLIIEPFQAQIENIDGQLFRVIGPFVLEPESNNTIRLDNVVFTPPFFPNPPMPGGPMSVKITFNDGIKESISKIGAPLPFIEFTGHQDPQAGVRRNADGTFNFLLSVEQQSISPLKQIKSGVALFDLKCNEGLTLIQKYDGAPACVKPETKIKLIERGWGVIPDNRNSKTSVPVNFDTIDFSKTINANNQFAFDYYAQANENQNIFFSPWSITSAFAIVNEGAKANTADEIQNVFGLDENSKENFKAINKILNQENPGYIIEVANSLWLAEDFTLHSDYVDTVQTYYDGVIEKVDFADDGTDVINGWVSEKTRQKNSRTV